MIPIKHHIPNNLRIVIEKLNKRPSGAESYVKDKLEKLGIKVKRSGTKGGVPDFICKFKKQKFWVEVKGWNDSLRISQIEWIKKNPQKIVYLYVLRKGWKDYEDLL